ncbi:MULTISPECIES: hypothetical protein [unclassified Pseudomonas]|uniref:hypothetical protein n=1 Tax=unclassified Pseudomonas TaxID=196821 RepID=UPI000A1FABA1|nr:MULTISPECIES: hypothetical protein [unclassified Pseudomonas]
MGRFSETFKTGYNKEVIEKAKLKNGDNITIHAFHINASTFLSLESDGITAAQDSQRKCPKRFVFDEFALGPEYTELLKGIDGVAPEVITLYSSNPEFYKNCEDAYDELVSEIIEAGASIITTADLMPFSLNHTPVLIELKHPVEYLAEYPDSIETSWEHYAHSKFSDPIVRKLKNYSLLGYLDNNAPFLSSAQYITVSGDKVLRDVKTQLAEQYSLLNYFTAPDNDIVISTQDIRTVYSLAGVENFKSVTEARTTRKSLIAALLETGAKPVRSTSNHDDLTTETGPILVFLDNDAGEINSHYGYFGLITAHDVYSGSITVSCSISSRKTYDALCQQHALIEKFAAHESVEIDESEIAAIYTLADIKFTAEPVPSNAQTTEALYPAAQWGLSVGALNNGMLPNMTGFEHSELGTGDCVWASPCHVLADRDLQLGESVHVWAVDPIDGRVLKTVSLKATEANKARVAWPAALVKAIQADRTLVEGSVLLQAGHLSDDAEFTENADAPTSQTFTVYNNIEKSKVDRLWAFDSHCKLLSNLPFKANQVCALRLPDAEPRSGERVCIQVRHRTSQHLYKSHFYQPEANSTRGSWSKQLCEFLNQDSPMLRAGKLQDDGISITPAEQGNQVWIPQLSDLSVQLESVNWLEHASFTVNSGLALEDKVIIAVHDHVTGAPLPGSPFTFCPSVATQAQDQWPSALARQLAGSPLAPYIKLEQASSGGTAPASTWRCLRAAVPLRIWMSEPLASPAWSSRAGKDIDDVLEACLDEDSFQLLIESRDTRTGYLCHASSITLPAMESSLDQAAKRAKLAKTLEQHLKKNGVVWLGLSIESNVSGTSKNHWKLCEATDLHLQTTLEKITPSPITANKHGTLPLPFYIDKLITNGAIQELNNHIFKTGTAKLQPYEYYIDPIYYSYLKIFQEGHAPLDAIEKIVTKNPARINILIPQTSNTFDVDVLHRLNDPGRQIIKGDRDTSWMPISPIPQKTSGADYFIMKGYENFIYGDGLSNHECIEALAPAFHNRKLIKKTLSDVATTQGHFATIEIRTASPWEQLCIALDTQATDKGFSLVSCSQNDGELTLDLNFPFEPDEESATAGILTGIVSPSSLWKKIQSCTTTREVFEIPAQDTLCADMANTLASELFASSDSQPHGVSPQTGLFHFHHTIATLSSLSGNTPAIPLAFNYSPLRANESGLGDGFAFSGFSSYDNRNRRLVLSNGTVHELSIDDIKQLINGKSIVRLGYTLKAGQGTTEELSARGGTRKVYHLSSFTIELLNGHEEVLGLPQTRDNLESGGAYKDSLKRKIKRIIQQIDNALTDLKSPSKDAAPIWSILGVVLAGPIGLVAGKKIDDYEKTRCIHLSSVVATFISTAWGADMLGKDREKLKKVIASETELDKLKIEMMLTLAEVERNALVLVPLQLKADNRALQLAWQGVKGHVRLKSIKDGDNVLLKAEHSAEPMLEGSQQSVFTLWPETDESCCITLDIKDCLLRRLTRSSGSQTDKPDQRLHFQYTVSETLDNVLCGIAKDDGSREVVAYDWRAFDSLPRVELHTLVPGGQQPNTHHAWAWEGEKRITAATRYAHAPVGSDLEQVPSTRWEWSHSADGATQLARLIEKVPGEQQRITRYVYQTDNGVPEPLRQPRQTEQHITVEDLRVAATAEEQQP